MSLSQDFKPHWPNFLDRSPISDQRKCHGQGWENVFFIFLSSTDVFFVFFSSMFFRFPPKIRPFKNVIFYYTTKILVRKKNMFLFPSTKKHVFFSKPTLPKQHRSPIINRSYRFLSLDPPPSVPALTPCYGETHPLLLGGCRLFCLVVSSGRCKSTYRSEKRA